MEPGYFQDQVFEKTNFSVQPLAKGEYENCRFDNCEMAEADLSGILFLDCIFTNSNLSLARLQKTGFNQVQFHHCKLLGLQFGDCNPIGLSLLFEHCLLDHASFYRLKLKKTIFRHCKLEGADFTETDLTESVFDHCQLLSATFDHTLLEKADFRTAYQYTIDPESNRVRKARFSLPEVTGLLNKYDIRIDN